MLKSIKIHYLKLQVLKAVPGKITTAHGKFIPREHTARTVRFIDGKLMGQIYFSSITTNDEYSLEIYGLTDPPDMGDSFTIEWNEFVESLEIL